MKYRNIRVLVARSIEAIEDPRGACDDVRKCDTVKEAKEFARYALTLAYRDAREGSELMNVARVMADEDGREVCIFDCSRKALPRSTRVVPDSVLIPRELLTRLIDRLEARTPAPTLLTDPATLNSGQREQNASIYADRSLIDQARDVLRP